MKCTMQTMIDILVHSLLTGLRHVSDIVDLLLHVFAHQGCSFLFHYWRKQRSCRDSDRIGVKSRYTAKDIMARAVSYRCITISRYMIKLV